MKFTKQDFLQSPQMMINVDEHIKVEENDFLRHSPVRSIPSAHITGTLSYDGKALVTSDLKQHHAGYGSSDLQRRSDSRVGVTGITKPSSVQPKP